MITFRDTTYCSAECARTECSRHLTQEAKDRVELHALAFLPTAWCDFSEHCGMHIPVTPAAA